MGRPTWHIAPNTIDETKMKQNQPWSALHIVHTHTHACAHHLHVTVPNTYRTRPHLPVAKSRAHHEQVAGDPTAAAAVR